MAKPLANIKHFLSLSAWRAGLKAHYSVPLEIPFKQFRNGSIYFGVGCIIIFMANQQLPHGLKQELIVLAGLILAGVGFIMAMLAQIRMIISRFVRFKTGEPETKPTGTKKSKRPKTN